LRQVADETLWSALDDQESLDNYMLQKELQLSPD
jgi:hypothetical protein